MPYEQAPTMYFWRMKPKFYTRRWFVWGCPNGTIR
uniref:Uncharacterized protein n=1 Tax=Siphoviridae sp. ctE6L85 TaxID=2826202 RepID=A0A8S5QRN0_9CAUD|nr:MAG TPA: Protein of unknown function (DUF2537) [Siphoviridae sp. ctE6L85]